MKKVLILLPFVALVMVLVTGCEYDAEKYSTKIPADFYYVNNSDHKMDMLFLPQGVTSSGYDTLIDKTTIHLRPGESVLVKTDDPVDGNDPIFGQFVVIYDDTEFFSYFSNSRVSSIWTISISRGWDRKIPLYPISYKKLSGTNEFGHQTLEFIFTNEHYDMMKEGKDNVNDTIITVEHGERFFKGWNLYKKYSGVDIGGVHWAPVDYVNEYYGDLGYSTYHEAMHGCPLSWRLPTAEEYKILSTNHSAWNAKYSDDSGMRFSGLKEYSADSPSLLLTPDVESGVYREGNFWTSTKVSDDEALVFSFNNNNKVSLEPAGISKRYRVRCVKTEKRKYI